MQYWSLYCWIIHFSLQFCQFLIYILCGSIARFIYVYNYLILMDWLLLFEMSFFAWVIIFVLKFILSRISTATLALLRYWCMAFIFPSFHFKSVSLNLKYAFEGNLLLVILSASALWSVWSITFNASTDKSGLMPKIFLFLFFVSYVSFVSF